jgi:hypothetical protein
MTMKTINERPLEKRGVWAPVCATAGSAIWATIAVLARLRLAPIGAIELLFLFAPLVIVPLGMELGRTFAPAGIFAGKSAELAQRLQPLAAILAVIALWLPPGKNAALLALGWLLVSLLMAASGIAILASALRAYPDADASAGRATSLVLAIARIDLAIGGAWLVASRLGLRPAGIQEPIGLLTAVHFHFAGFATATIAAATLQFAARRSRHQYVWLKPVALLVAGLPIVVAAGFVISPLLKMIAAVLFSASVAALAIALRAGAQKAEAPAARILLQLAATFVFAGMVLSTAYAVADYLGSDALPIPQMARTHGILNAIGFCLLGLLGWLIECSTHLRMTDVHTFRTERSREAVH